MTQLQVQNGAGTFTQSAFGTITSAAQKWREIVPLFSAVVMTAFYVL